VQPIESHNPTAAACAAKESNVNHFDLIKKLGGDITSAGMPFIHSKAYQTSAGTPYLKAPGVVMIARPQVDLTGMGAFLDGFDPALGFDDYLEDRQLGLDPGARLAKVAGQTCYLSFGPKRTKNAEASAYLKNIKASGHGSVLEHASYSFLLYGISRSMTHELVRHRVGTAYSQVSQRYVGGKLLRFVERPEFASDPDLHREFEARVDNAALSYEAVSNWMARKQAEGDELLSGEAKTERLKKVRQAARAGLPNETEAPIVFSANVRALRHVIEMRASPHAEVEIREAFFRVFLCAAAAEPLLFEDYELVTLSDGTNAVRTPFAKV
jgi:thymidylate synthase (FAD)